MHLNSVTPFTGHRTALNLSCRHSTEKVPHFQMQWRSQFWGSRWNGLCCGGVTLLPFEKKVWRGLSTGNAVNYRLPSPACDAERDGHESVRTERSLSDGN